MEHWQAIGESSREVGTGLFFSLLVITVSFLPIITMEAQEGRLFSPLAFTKTYAMAAAAILTITLVPVMVGYFVRGKIIPEQLNPINRFFTLYSRASFELAMRWRAVTVILTALLMASMLYPLSKIGSEFMPPLMKAIFYTCRLPSRHIHHESQGSVTADDKMLKTFPEVHHVFGKIGRAETATDAAPLMMVKPP